MINKKINKKGMALSQVFSLILAIIAIAFFAGLQLPTVSSKGQESVSLVLVKEGHQHRLKAEGSIPLELQGYFSDGYLTAGYSGLEYEELITVENMPVGQKTTIDSSDFIVAQENYAKSLTQTEHPRQETSLKTDSKENGDTPFTKYFAYGTTALNLGGLAEKGEKTFGKVKSIFGFSPSPDQSISSLKTVADTTRGLKAAQNSLSVAKSSSSFYTPLDTTRGLKAAQDSLNGVDTAANIKNAKALQSSGSSNIKTGFFKKIFGKGPNQIKGAADLANVKTKISAAKTALTAAKATGDAKKVATAAKNLKNLRHAKAGLSVASKTTAGFGLQIAGMATLGAQFAIQVFKIAGAGERNVRQVKTGAYIAAVTVTAAAMVFKGALTAMATAGTIPGIGWAAAIVVAVAAGVYAAITYQDYSQEIVTYQLSIWQPESKGEHCTECNDLRYGCSEYQCKTFGAACVILNPGTKEEMCDWNNSKDIQPPIMTQLDILDADYKYNPTKKIQLPDRGVELIYVGKGASEENCIPAFTAVKFGVETDEPAECKIDLTRKMIYGEMISFMTEGSVYVYNHTLEIPSSAFPSNYSLTEAGWAIETGKDHSFYIRCRDANDNISPYHLVMNFCVDQGPDTTPPTISTNYLNDAYITYNQTTIENVEVYTNEPADCKWDFKDITYKDMSNTMSECSQKIGQYTFPNTYSYGCKTEINGLKNGEENKFYIRCQDKPLWKKGDKERRISNEESYELTLKGTNPLVIESITIQDKEAYSVNKNITEDFIFQDSTNIIPIKMTVKTTQGAGEIGASRCGYIPLGGKLKYEFYNNGNFDYASENINTFRLSENYYNYDIQCCDLANNCDTANVDFIVDTDLSPPEVVRAYFEEGNMKIVTNEASDCAYMLDTCNYLFKDGIRFITSDDTDHYTDWDTGEDLYVKCQDRFGNVLVDTCSIIVRATENYEGEEVAVKKSLSIDF